MTDVNQNCVNHLRVTFNLKAPVVDAFVQDQPHKDLQRFRALLDAFGAKVSSVGKSVLRDMPESSAMREQLDALCKKTLSENPGLARKLNGDITVELADDRNVKAFVASLELGPYDNVIRKKSIRIETHVYDENEISQAMDGDGIVKPPYPPVSARYVLE